MNQIQYRNIEGQHKFFALIGMPDEPKYSDFVQHSKYYLQVNKYERAKRNWDKQVASITENAPEIINCKYPIVNFSFGMVWKVTKLVGGSSNTELKHNDIFSLPEGYEFYELLKCPKCSALADKPCKVLMDCSAHISTEKVVRIVKAEVKQCNHRYGRCTEDCVCIICGEPESKPEPEESKTLTETDFYKLLGIDNTNAIAVTIWNTLKHHQFTIQRKKP